MTLEQEMKILKDRLAQMRLALEDIAAGDPDPAGRAQHALTIGEIYPDFPVLERLRVAEAEATRLKRADEQAAFLRTLVEWHNGAAILSAQIGIDHLGWKENLLPHTVKETVLGALVGLHDAVHDLQTVKARLEATTEVLDRVCENEIHYIEALMHIEKIGCMQYEDEDEFWCKKDGSAHSIYCPAGIARQTLRNAPNREEDEGSADS
jgi:hypothetical protein